MNSNDKNVKYFTNGIKNVFLNSVYIYLGLFYNKVNRSIGDDDNEKSRYSDAGCFIAGTSWRR